MLLVVVDEFNQFAYSLGGQWKLRVTEKGTYPRISLYGKYDHAKRPDGMPGGYHTVIAFLDRKQNWQWQRSRN